MKLILLRHALQEGISFDDTASLSLKGRYQQEETNKFLRQEGYIPDLVLTSPTKRAQETGALLHEAFLCPVKVEPALSPDFNKEVLEKHLHNDHVDTLCLIGHSPSLYLFAKTLMAKLPVPEINRSSALILDLDVDKHSVKAKLVAYITPQGVTKY